MKIWWRTWKKFVIDEEKLSALTGKVKTKKGTELKTSDHNSIVCRLKCKWNKQLKKHRIEHFNFKDTVGLKRYKEMTSNNILTSIVEKEDNVNTLTSKLLKRLNGVLHKCFKRIRITKNDSDNEIQKLFDQRRRLRSKTYEESKEILKEVDDKLADKCAERNVEKIREELKDIKCDEGGFNVGRLWKLRKKLCPFKKDLPTAMLDQH